MQGDPPDGPTGWTRGTTTALLAVALVSSLALAGVGVAAGQGTSPPARTGQPALQDDADNTTLSPADEIYVRDDGDAVLVYESDATDVTSGRYTVDVSAGLLHALAVTETDGEFQGSMSASAVLEQSRLAGNGSLTVQRPQSLESLDLQVGATSTHEEASMDATLSAAFATSAAPSTQLLDSAATSGTLVTTGSALATEGTAEVQLGTPLGPSQLHSFTLRESADTYTLEGEQNYVVSSNERRRWATREQARRTLQAMYGAVGEQLGGEASVTLESYSFTERSDGESYRLHVVFTVEYTGIDEGVTRIITQQLANSRQFDLSEQEAAAVAERVAAIRIDHASFTFEQSAESASASWSARVENYNELTLAMADLLEAMETDDGVGSVPGSVSSFLPEPETMRDRVEARRSTNYTQRVTWSGELAQPTQERTTVEAEVHVATENRAAYVDALQEAGIQVTNVTFDVSARTEGEEVLASAAVEMDRQEMLDQGLDALLNASEGADIDPRARKALEAFKRAELQRARLDFSLEDGTGRIELGAKFEDLSAFRDVLAVSGEAPAITGIVGTVEDETTTSYVHVEGAVSADASEDDVRALAYVDDETVVHMPGTYNRTFPEPNGTEAREYLGLPSPTPSPGDGDGSTGMFGPGFGPVAAMAALGAAVALLARRRSS